MKKSLALLLASAGFAAVTVAQSPVPPIAGDLAVSELMFNPGPDLCVTDNNGEYFELTNISTKVLDLNGIFVQDYVTSTPTFFQVLPSVATLPPLYPGQRFLFARTAAAATNGGLTNVDYPYQVLVNPAPVDFSQVGVGSMNLGNGNTGDGIRISVGGPLDLPVPAGYVQGTEIARATVCVTSAPFTSSGSGQAAERIDLFAPMEFTPGSPLVNSPNLAVSTTSNLMPCGTNSFFGTPRLPNSVDNSSWPTNVNYDSLTYANTGTLRFTSPVSVGVGSATFKVDGGASLAGLPYNIGFSDDVPGEYPIELFLPGNPGSIVIDLPSSGWINNYASFDGTGKHSNAIPVPANPLLIGLSFQLQWLAVDTNVTIVCSNGVRVTVTN